MSTGLDRFERLFAKRKGSVTTQDAPYHRAAVAATPSGGPEPLFPSPSFIRPKSSRMTARDEVLVTPNQGARRAKSLPETRVPDRPSSASPGQSRVKSFAGAFMSYTQSRPVSRSEMPQTETVFSRLDRFQFPVPPRTSACEATPTVLPMPIHLPPSPAPPRSSYGGSPRSQSPRNFIGFEPRVITPPPETRAELEATRANPPGGKSPPDRPSLQLSSTARPPTPGPSPPNSPPPPANGSKAGAFGQDPPCADTQHQARFVSQPALRKMASQMSQAPPSVIYHTPNLKEPELGDFLSLSDDDIAEAILDTPDDPFVPAGTPAVPTKMEPAQSTAPKRSPRSSTGSTYSTMPQSRHQIECIRQQPAATAAAFETARIASQFGFDLVYVLNLWPEAEPPKRGSHMSRASAPIVNSRCGMTGRLLAAYGLSTVRSPLSISAAVHSKILRTEGWIEYRNQGEEPVDFARGYACSFYADKFGGCQTAGDRAPRHEVDSGIVFAAYRKETQNGTRYCNGAELAELHRSAEALVDMIIVMHLAEHGRRLKPRKSISEITGPLPTRHCTTST